MIFLHVAVQELVSHPGLSSSESWSANLTLFTKLSRVAADVSYLKAARPNGDLCSAAAAAGGVSSIARPAAAAAEGGKVGGEGKSITGADLMRKAP